MYENYSSTRILNLYTFQRLNFIRASVLHVLLCCALIYIRFVPVNIVGMRVTYATENGKKCQENKIQKII